MKHQTQDHILKRAKARRRGQYFNCIVCNKQFWRKPFEIKQGNNKYCSKRCYFKGQIGKKKDVSNRVFYMEDKNPNWRGGVTPTNKKIRQSKEMEKWRDGIFMRDNWTCQKCFVRSKKNNYIRIEAHHVKPFAIFPELRFSMSNGLTLCKKCHDKEPKGKEIYIIKEK